MFLYSCIYFLFNWLLHKADELSCCLVNTLELLFNLNSLLWLEIFPLRLVNEIQVLVHRNVQICHLLLQLVVVNFLPNIMLY